MKNIWSHLIIALIMVPVITLAQQASTGEVGGSGGDHPGGAAEMLRSTWQGTHISQRVARRLLIRGDQPPYPEDARHRHIEGQVILRTVIDKQGNVERVSLVSGHPMLAPAAIEAVKQRKYKPYLLNGEPVPVETQVAVNFELPEH
jgi:periplasmic protein TonB